MMNGKLKKSIISGIVATSLILSLAIPSAFANEELPEQPVAEEVKGDGSSVGLTIVVDTNFKEGSAEEKESIQKEALDKTQGEKEPSLVPGDFFYFVKIMMEKIRLAVTNDDYKEARLLAEFAEERIAEANALFAEGKSEEAEEVLKEAIATQEEAAENLADSEVDSEGKTEVNKDEATNEEAVQEIDPEEESEEIVSEKNTDEDVVKVKLANNIDALTAALSHVKNPTAQKALRKNIEKSFAKLDKKLAKMEKKAAKFATKEKEVAVDLVEEAELVVKKDIENTEVTTPVTADPIEEETEVIQQVAANPVVAEKKQNAAERKNVAQVKKEENQLKAKENKQNAQNKSNTKKNNNENKGNGKGKGNGNGNGKN